MNSRDDLLQTIYSMRKAFYLHIRSKSRKDENYMEFNDINDFIKAKLENPEAMQIIIDRNEAIFGSLKRRYYFFWSFAFLSVVFFYIDNLIVSFVIDPLAQNSNYQSMFLVIALIALIPACLSSLMPYFHYKIRRDEMADIMSMNFFPYFLVFNTSKLMKFGAIISFILLVISFLTGWEFIFRVANYFMTLFFVALAAHFSWIRAIQREASQRSRILDWETDEKSLPEEKLKLKDSTTKLYNIGGFLIYIVFTLFILFRVKPMTETSESPLFELETYITSFSHPFFWLFIFGFILRIVAFFRSFGYVRKR